MTQINVPKLLSCPFCGEDAACMDAIAEVLRMGGVKINEVQP